MALRGDRPVPAVPVELGLHRQRGRQSLLRAGRDRGRGGPAGLAAVALPCRRRQGGVARRSRGASDGLDRHRPVAGVARGQCLRQHLAGRDADHGGDHQRLRRPGVVCRRARGRLDPAPAVRPAQRVAGGPGRPPCRAVPAGRDLVAAGRRAGRLDRDHADAVAAVPADLWPGQGHPDLQAHLRRTEPDPRAYRVVRAVDLPGVLGREAGALPAQRRGVAEDVAAARRRQQRRHAELLRAAADRPVRGAGGGRFRDRAADHRDRCARRRHRPGPAERGQQLRVRPDIDVRAADPAWRRRRDHRHFRHGARHRHARDDTDHVRGRRRRRAQWHGAVGKTDQLDTQHAEPSPRHQPGRRLRHRPEEDAEPADGRDQGHARRRDASGTDRAVCWLRRERARFQRARLDRCLRRLGQDPQRPGRARARRPGRGRHRDPVPATRPAPAQFFRRGLGGLQQATAPGPAAAGSKDADTPSG